MTRINIVPVEELYDQHLFAEFREIKMIPSSLARSLAAARKRRDVVAGILTPEEAVLCSVSDMFTLNTGHVKFFYDKGGYLRKRYRDIKAELQYRGINYSRQSRFDPDGVMRAYPFNEDWVPHSRDLRIIRARISQKISMKPEWYRYSG